MSVFRNSTFGAFTRGGQTTIHFARMSLQLIKKFFHVCLFSYILIVGLIIYKTTNQNDWYYSFRFLESYTACNILNACQAKTKISTASGAREISYTKILNSRHIYKYVQNTLLNVYWALGVGLFSILLLGVFLVRFVYRTGRSQTGDAFVRGTEIVDTKTLKKAIKYYNYEHNKGHGSRINVAGIELPHKFDKSHVLLIGSTGTGKSVNFREALASIRVQGKKAIIYDVAGNFIKHFYREGRDIILNPMDERSCYWNLWSDCKSEGDAIAFAQSLIPDSYRRDFFDIAAKVVFSSLIFQMGKQPNPSIQALMDLILKVDFETILKAVKDTDAASILNSEAGRMAASVRGVISANTRSMKFLKQSGVEFSITDWVTNPQDDSWVFISCNDKQIDMLRPIITAWFNIFTSNVLSLPECEQNRIYMVIDELPSLNKVPSLINFLAQGRKYGGCALIGMQNYSQLVEIYGKNGADAICDLCSTWVVLRCNSKEGAKWVAENMGNRECIETNEGLSFGVNDIRDGVSINKNRVDRLLVNPTEIMHLPDLTGFIKLGRGFPVAKFISEYKKYPMLAEAFIAASVSDDTDSSQKTIEKEIEDSGQLISDGIFKDKETNQAHLKQKIELDLREMEF
ncbi:MAG: type IV secretion system DNA-binding domain-containing protein [Rickettsiaceae bacterium]|nr:type IV secretion system DNA-binding domain-containing protein [Rickettsiaceae bacterium]